MITYEEIKRLIRFKEKDNNEIRFSDYDIKYAVNECIRYINNSYALQNSDFLEKVHTYNEEELNRDILESNVDVEGEGEIPQYNFRDLGIALPEDFISLVSVKRVRDGYIMSPVESIKTPLDGQYKVVSGKIYSGNPTIEILYRAAIAEISDSNQQIDLPFVFKDAIAKVSCLILNNAETDVLLKAVENITSAIVPRRRYSNAHIKMPFKV